MGYTKSDYLNIIIVRLGMMCSIVKMQNGNLRYDINRDAEDFYAGFLNLVYGYTLSNGNAIKANLHVIDLRDEARWFAVQVTSDTSSAEVRETLKGVLVTH